MALVVRTARLSYGGSDRLDVTWRSATGHGRAFAPTWALLESALIDRRRAKDLRAQGQTEEADQLERMGFERYAEAYRHAMRESYRRHRPSWDWLLSEPAVVLVCYCTAPTYCHRTLLASYLERLGAELQGELPASMQRRTARATHTTKKKESRRPA